MPRGSSSLAWFRDLFGFDETTYSETRAKFTVTEPEPGTYVVTSLENQRAFHVGPFACLSVGQLRAERDSWREMASTQELGYLKFLNVTGDVRTLHRDPANASAVFQVASQFNCLEMVGPNVRPEDGIARYAGDATQGPACAMCCPGATVFRNYFVNQHGQAGKHQLNLLDEIEKLVDNRTHQYWSMENGYCLPTTPQMMGAFTERLQQDDALAAAVAENLKVGIHWDTLVDADKHHVCQVFCSAVPISYSRSTPLSDWGPLACLVLDSAYEATLLAAWLLAFKRKQRVKVYLTALGGGAFGNPHQWIAQAIKMALVAHKDAPLDVFLVHYNTIPRGWYEGLESCVQSPRGSPSK